jgi:hypothetical protein
MCISGNVSPRILSETFLHRVDDTRRSTIESVMPLLQEHISNQELSGLMGRGDHDAIVQLQAGLARIGLDPTVPERAGRPSGEELKRHLIVVGGPDVNVTTSTMLERLPCKLIVTRNADGRNVVRDLVHRQDYGPSIESNGRSRDYGVLIRAKNPNNPSHEVLICAGAHGFGSLAAAVVAFECEEELLRSSDESGAGFECLVYYERDGEEENSLNRATLVFVRKLSGNGQ